MSEDSERSRQPTSHSSTGTRQSSVGRRAFIAITGTAAASTFAIGNVAASEEGTTTNGSSDTVDSPDAFIGPDGDDTSGDGSAENPWFSIDHAASSISTGDTIGVQDGTYEYGTKVQVISTNEITVRAAEDASPTLVWSGNAAGWENQITEGLRINGANGVTVDGLEIRDSHSAGVQIDGSHDCTLRNLDVHSNGTLGILCAFGFSGTHLYRCDSHDNGVASTATEGDGFVFNGASGDSTGSLVEECRSWENIEDGYDCWNGNGITFRRCQAFNNGRPNSETPESTAMGIGFKMGGGTYGGGNRAEHCLAWGNYYVGFSDNVPAEGCTVYNCTAYDNGDYADNTAKNYEFSHGGSELANNISYDAPVHINGATETTNTWNLGIDDPQFRNVDPSRHDTFRLSDGSPCRNAGTDVGLEYEGDAPTLGAFE